MGVLKLSVIEEQMREEEKKSLSQCQETTKVSACSCPCWAFVKKGQVVMDSIRSTASWNID